MSYTTNFFKKISLKVALAFCFLPCIGFSQNQWDIQFSQSTLLTGDQVCYNVEVRSSTPTSWTLGDQNYRFFFDGDLITVNAVTSLLPPAFYSPANIDQNIKLSGLGQEAASPLDDIDNNLGFLDFNITQTDKSNPPNAAILEANNFTAVAEICLTIDLVVLNGTTGNTCLSLYHVAADNAGMITNQYTTISENDAPGSTTPAVSGFYDHLTSDDGAESCLGTPNIEPASFRLKAKLQGAMLGVFDNLMRDNLRSLGLIPLQEPYSDLLSFDHIGSGGGEFIDTAMLTTEGENAIVDWVFIEIRDAMVPDSVIATQSAILQRDGDVTDADGNPILNFSATEEGSYFVAIRHRNHLGVMTGTPILLDTDNPPMIDFSDLSVNTWGTAAQSQTPQSNEMWAGDLNGDRQIIYQGPTNDVTAILLSVLADSMNTQHITNFVKRAYDSNDFDLDGKIIYQGPNNDRGKLLIYSILDHPLNTGSIVNFINREQLPQ